MHVLVRTIIDRFNVCHGDVCVCIAHECLCVLRTRFHLCNNASVLYVSMHEYVCVCSVSKINTVNRSLYIRMQLCAGVHINAHVHFVKQCDPKSLQVVQRPCKTGSE